MPLRFVQRTNLGQASSKAFEERAAAFWQVSSNALPFLFTDPDAKHARGIVANDADPNTTEPDAAARVLSERCAALGIYAECTAEVGLEVWVQSGLTTAGDPAWICVKRGITVAPATRALVPVEVGWSKSFVRVVSGASAGTPVNLFIGVC